MIDQSGLDDHFNLLSLGAEFVDRTDDIRNICSKLKPGELVRDQNFSLHEALAAIEIMNPKMDTGCDYDQGCKYTPAMCLDFQPTVQDLAQIAHQLFRAKATWLKGKALGQTILTCCFMHDLMSTRNPMLSLIVRANSLFIKLVNDVAFYSELSFEEDLIRDMHGIKAIKCDIPALIEELDAKAAGKDYGEQSDDSLFLKSYLTFLKYILALLVRTSDRELDDKYLEKSLRKISDAISDMKNNLSQMNKVPEDVFGFDEWASRRLSVTTPLMPVKLKSFEESSALFLSVIDDLKYLMAHIPSTNQITVYKIFDLLSCFADRRPNILCRAIVILWILQDGRLLGHNTQPIIESTFLNCFGIRLGPLSQFRPSEDYTRLLREVIYDSCRVYCFNLGRQHRKFQKLLYSWEELQAIAQALDTEIIESMGGMPKQPEKGESAFSYWTFDLKNVIYERIFFLGFDLQLYRPAEYLGIFWHLALIYTHQLSVLDHIQPKLMDCRKALLVGKKEFSCGFFTLILACMRENLIPSLKLSDGPDEALEKSVFMFRRRCMTNDEIDMHENFRNDMLKYTSSSENLFQRAQKQFENGRVLGMNAGTKVESAFLVDWTALSDALIKSSKANFVSAKVTEVKLEEFKKNMGSVSGTFDSRFSLAFLLLQIQIAKT